MPFPLLDFPPEIREKIYLYTLVSPNPIPLTADSLLLLSPDPSNPSSPYSSSSSQVHLLFPHALLLTCHQIYHEVRPLYFAHNTFLLFLARNANPLLYFISPSFLDNRRRIKVLRLVIARWGKHNFFLTELAPLLEDMILNGSLRHLEVWARRLHFFVASKDNGMVFREGTTVERLVGILRDTYLERVVLKTPFEAGFGPETYDPSVWQDPMSVFNGPMEDVTRLITSRGEDYQSQTRKIQEY